MPTVPSPARQPVNVPPPETPGLRGLMTLAVGVVVVASLYLGRDIAIPIVIAVLLSFVLAPVVELLQRLRLWRIPAVVIAVLTALGIILAVGGIIGMQVAQLAADLPRYQFTIKEKALALREGTIGRASDLLKNLGRQIEDATKPEPAPAPDPTEPSPQGEQRRIAVEVHQPEPSPLQLIRSVLGPILHPLATLGIVLVVTVFILLRQEDLRDRMIRLFGASDLHRTTVAMDDAARRLSRFFLTQLALNASFGVVIAIGLWMIGVPSPVLWGIFAALMRFVPYIGSFIAGGLPVALAAAVDPGWTMALWTLALFLVSEPLMGHVVEPLVYGHGTGLSPFAVVVSAIFWTWLWGPVGLLLATPLTLCLVVLGRHVERLEFLDVLFGDRPALSPPENFYQRILAGDPDEALEQAELLLKERSLSSYYDEVALKGLQLAASDAERGVLEGHRLDAIKAAVATLVEDLSTHADADRGPAAEEDPAGASLSEKALPKRPAVAADAPPASQRPPEWRSEAPILCIAGRGPLDEAASTMLAQLLHKHGLGARVVPRDAASRGNIKDLDLSGVAMVCISYLAASESVARLRYLIRRLRQRIPQAPILVGLWHPADGAAAAERLCADVGPDACVTTLRGAVAACVKAAQEASNPSDRTEPAGRSGVPAGLEPVGS